MPHSLYKHPHHERKKSENYWNGKTLSTREKEGEEKFPVYNRNPFFLTLNPKKKKKRKTQQLIRRKKEGLGDNGCVGGSGAYFLLYKGEGKRRTAAFPFQATSKNEW